MGLTSHLAELSSRQHEQASPSSVQGIVKMTVFFPSTQRDKNPGLAAEGRHMQVGMTDLSERPPL